MDDECSTVGWQSGGERGWIGEGNGEGEIDVAVEGCCGVVVDLRGRRSSVHE